MSVTYLSMPQITFRRHWLRVQKLQWWVWGGGGRCCIELGREDGMFGQMVRLTLQIMCPIKLHNVIGEEFPCDTKVFAHIHLLEAKARFARGVAFVGENTRQHLPSHVLGEA